jgi:hypothetical protein
VSIVADEAVESLAPEIRFGVGAQLKRLRIAAPDRRFVEPVKRFVHGGVPVANVDCIAARSRAVHIGAFWTLVLTEVHMFSNPRIT